MLPSFAGAQGSRKQPVLPILDGLSAVMIDEAILLKEQRLQRYWQAVGLLSPSRLKQALSSQRRLDCIQASRLSALAIFSKRAIAFDIRTCRLCPGCRDLLVQVVKSSHRLQQTSHGRSLVALAGGNRQ